MLTGHNSLQLDALGAPVPAESAAACLEAELEELGVPRPPRGDAQGGAPQGHDRGCCDGHTLVLKQLDSGSAFVSAISVAAPMGLHAMTVAAPPMTTPVPAGLVWKEFWKKVGGWLAKRGIAAGAVAAADGPLPIGDLIALGIGLWTLYELLDHWDELWAAAVAAAEALMAQNTRKKAAGLFEQLNIHLARLLRRPVNGKDPDHQGNPEGYDDAHWLKEIINFLNQLYRMGYSERQIRRIIENKWGSEKFDLVMAALAALAQQLGQPLPPFFGK